MTIINLRISITQRGLKVVEKPYPILKANTKTYEIETDNGSKRIKKSKVGANNSLAREDIIGAMYFSTWIFPEDVEEARLKTILAFRRELQERWRTNIVMIESADDFLKDFLEDINQD